MSEIEIELYRGYTSAQERRAYFLIAGAAASIAFAVTRTEGAAWSTPMWVWLTSVVLWGGSFFSGLRHMAFVASTTYANIDLLRVEAGIHREVGNHPGMVAAASDGIRTAMTRNSGSAVWWSSMQWALLVLGSVAFLAWHVWEIILRP